MLVEQALGIRSEAKKPVKEACPISPAIVCPKRNKAFSAGWSAGELLVRESACEADVIALRGDIEFRMDMALKGLRKVTLRVNDLLEVIVLELFFDERPRFVRYMLRMPVSPH